VYNFFKLYCLAQISNHHDYSQLAPDLHLDFSDTDNSILPFFFCEWHHAEHLRFFVRTQHRQYLRQRVRVRSKVLRAHLRVLQGRGIQDLRTSSRRRLDEKYAALLHQQVLGLCKSYLIFIPRIVYQTEIRAKQFINLPVTVDQFESFQHFFAHADVVFQYLHVVECQVRVVVCCCFAE